MKFPLIIYTKTQLDKDFDNLCNNNDEQLTYKIIGNKCSNYFFQSYRIKTKVCGKSHESIWNNDQEKIYKNAAKLYKKNDNFKNYELQATVRLFKGSCNQFKPYVARYLYQKFNAISVLDPYCGWGDRLLGAISLGIKYTGFDTNVNLKKPYSEMIAKYNYKDKSDIFFEDSSKSFFNKITYDFILTSPPYGNLEIYENMPTYLNDEDFIKNTFIPTMKNAWEFLDKTGTMCINIPDVYIEALKPHINYRGYMEIKLPIKNRRPSCNNIKKFEIIYCFKK